MKTILKIIAISILVLTILSGAISTLVFAQNGDIRGFVYDKSNGEVVIFTNVYLKGTTYGAATDVNGFYSITKVPVGDYILTTLGIGYDTVAIPVTIKANRIITQKIFLNPRIYELDEVEVSAARQEAKKEVKISTVKITPKQIKHIPSVGGEADLAQYLQILPGVIFTGDQGGQLYIRGGSPIQNKVLLDGMVIYNPFHSIGLFSVFETDIIKNVEVLTGGFNADHGGRISAIIDITTRDGNKKEYKGKVSASPFMAKALFEGPIKKLSETGGSSSFILTAKNSYLDQSSKFIYSYIDTAGLPYSFRDYYGKISLNASNGSKVNLFGFSFNDRVNVEGISDLNWNSFGFGTNYVIIPGQNNVLISGNFAWSRYLITQQQTNEKPRTSSIDGFNLGLDFTYFLTDAEIKYGFEVLGFSTRFEFFNFLGLRIEQDQNTTELAGFIKYRKATDKFVIEPGLRLHYFASMDVLSIEPRLGVKYNVSDRLRLKAASGLYAQNLISTVSDRDIVHLFTGFLSGPQVTLFNTKGEQANNNLQRAAHIIAGAEYDLAKHIEIDLEGYLKRFTQLINLNRDKLFATDPDYTIETGDAYGANLLVKYDYKRWFVWLVYSLGYVNRDNGQQTYPTSYDRRHNMNFVSAYTFGKKLNWEVSARWNLGSGFPFTLTQGFYEKMIFQNGIGTNYTTTNGQLGILYADQINGGRLPYYHRLDISIKKKFFPSANTELEAIATLTNVYNRENIFFFDRIRYERVNQLPLLPSVGVSFSF